MAKKKQASNIWHKFFGGREYMYHTTAKHKSELEPHIRHIKGQGDLHRVTKHKNKSRGIFYNLWDARV